MVKSKETEKSRSRSKERSKKRCRSRSPSQPVPVQQTRNQKKIAKIDKLGHENVKENVQRASTSNQDSVDDIAMNNNAKPVIVHKKVICNSKVPAKQNNLEKLLPAQHNYEAVSMDLTVGDELAVSMGVSDDEFQSKDESPTVNRLESLTYGPAEDEMDTVMTSPMGNHTSIKPPNAQVNITQFQSDPVFKDLVSRAVAEQMKVEREKIIQELNRGNTSDGAQLKEKSPLKTPVRISAGNINKRTQVVKSPSDTTIYIPVLQKEHKQIAQTTLTPQFHNPAVGNLFPSGDVNIEKQISEFVQQIRVADFDVGEQVVRQTAPETQPIAGTSRERPNTEQLQNIEVSEENQEQAWAIADKMIVDAEKYKATLEKPSGTVPLGTFNPVNQVSSFNPVAIGGSMNDEFFHITCHVNVNLISKIEKGEFDDLEKLLPKDPTKRAREYNKMELVSQDGSTYFVPANERDGKITGVHKWEQAFRVYAAIYTRANPTRAAEIWQYVYTINLATSSFVWENVANYDFTFRQLVSQNLNRSWAKIYHQMWSLSMRDPLHSNRFSQITNKSSNNNRAGRKDRDDYCWKFNKNHCKFGARCKFEHRCHYCDGYGHGSYNCGKKNKSRDNRSEKLEDNGRIQTKDYDKETK